jgi:hypothetical protein
MSLWGKSSGSRRSLAAAGLVAACGLAGCAGGGGSALGVAETPVPLRLPDLPPEVRLMGMEQGALEDLFGQPSVQRAEQPAEYWRYSLGRCQLDVFLYPDSATGQQEVAYFDVRPTGYEVVGADGCSDVARRFDPRWRENRQLEGS